MMSLRRLDYAATARHTRSNAERGEYGIMRGLTLDEALAMIEGTFASAKKRKAHPLSAIVLDAGGRVKAFQKQDGCSLLRFEIAYGKAFGALAMGRSSRMVLQK